MAKQTPRWIRVVVPIDRIDPWSLLVPLRDDGARLMAWAAPHQTESFVAIGALIEHRPEGRARFADAAAWWAPISKSMQSQTVDGKATHAPTPACLAGFAFRPNADRSDAWEAWGDAALCVPEMLVWSDDTQTSAVFTIDCQKGDSDKQLAALRDQLDQWIARSGPASASPTTADPVTDPNDFSEWEQWRARVQSAQESMAQGTLQKVVLARAQSYAPAAAHTFDPLATALALRHRQLGSTTFLICRKDGHAFLGSSPEVLVRLNNKHVKTVALAGTRRRDTGSTDQALSEALLGSNKDRLEQQLVARAITEALEPAVDDLQLSDAPEVVRHPDVQHLRTSIQGTLSDGSSIFDLVQRLHPTPAVGGLPRESALAWLDDNEHLDRGWYAGPVGWISDTGDGEFVVAIRSVLMAPDRASAFAGCGLVSSSNPADEWEESQVKLQTVQRGLATGLNR